MATGRVCSIEGCGKPAHARGWCNAHYIRWKTHGDPHREPPAPQQSCSIEGCGKRHFGRGLCNAHYTRWRKYGSPLEGQATPARPGEPLAWLHDMLGKAHDGCVIWPYGKHQKGYGAVKEDGVQHLVHRWVCERVHGPPPTHDHEAAHSCGNGHLGCVAPDHLRWATHKENMADSIALGRTGRGKPGTARKLTADDVREVRRLRGQLSQRQIAKRFGVSQGIVGQVQRRELWGWVE